MEGGGREEEGREGEEGRGEGEGEGQEREGGWGSEGKIHHFTNIVSVSMGGKYRD